MSRVMIELPGPWISGVTLAQVYDMRKMLVKAFGPDINIANVKPDDVFDTEALRVGLGVVGPTRPFGMKGTDMVCKGLKVVVLLVLGLLMQPVHRPRRRVFRRAASPWWSASAREA